ncbi:hypothetical protein M9H77_07104 [Catharanthus roseus]|uniref:Uncharacterized protein n=1 Tax=Catharanthus roseus TaxID=4058 RepID=A0ACC0BU74_CATRO|nr:hypothetical protein M9H77_07104 [Catharanthus roseus]
MAWMHIPIIRHRLDNAIEIYDEHAPFGAKWIVPFDMTSTSIHGLTTYRDLLISCPMIREFQSLAGRGPLDMLRDSGVSLSREGYETASMLQYIDDMADSQLSVPSLSPPSQSFAVRDRGPPMLSICRLPLSVSLHGLELPSILNNVDRSTVEIPSTLQGYPWNKLLDLESLQVFNSVEQQHNFYP